MTVDLLMVPFVRKAAHLDCEVWRGIIVETAVDMWSLSPTGSALSHSITVQNEVERRVNDLLHPPGSAAVRGHEEG